jgi:hypothetical protein
MAASVQEYGRSARSLADAPAAKGNEVIEQILRDELERAENLILRQLKRLANEIHGHSNFRSPVWGGSEIDVLLGGNSEAVIEDVNGTGRGDRADDRGDNCVDRLHYYVTRAAANLPRLALDPRSFFVDAMVEQAFVIQESSERVVHGNRDDN